MTLAVEQTPPPSGRWSLRRLRFGLGTKLVLGLVLMQAVSTLLFAWPGPGSSMHDLPIAVAGPNAVAQSAAQNLESSPKGAMHVTVLADLAAARTAVQRRDVYGALVIEDNGLHLLIASGASPAVAERLTQAVEQIQARGQGTYLQIEDIARNPRKDPRGSAPGAAVFALLATSLMAGAAVYRWLRGPRQRLAAIVAFAAVGGAMSAVELHVVLESLRGNLALEAGVLALLVLAVTSATVAFGVVAEWPGVGLAVALLLAIGYPISGATSAPELVPVPWDVVGRFLPGGAGNTALRGAAFFDGAGTTVPVLVLAGWSLFGLAVVALAGAGSAGVGLPGIGTSSPVRPSFNRASSRRPTP